MKTQNLLSFLALFWVAMCAVGCAQSDSYIVSGKDTSGRCPDGEWAYLSLQKNSPEDIQIIDSVKIVGNSFRFEGRIEKPTIAHVMTKAYKEIKRYKKPMILHSFILEKGEITTSCEDGMHFPSGTQLNDKISMFNNDLKGILARAEEDGLSEEELLERAFSLTKSYVKNNADNEFGVFLADYMTGEFDAVKELEMYALLHDKQEYFAKQIEHARKASAIQVDSPYIDISESDKSGKEISLKSVVEREGNKFVLLEFWASWCSPCMSEMPNLKAVYNKYHKLGFEIYASSLDDNRSNWEAAMKRFGMNWVCVSGLKGAGSLAPQKYIITAIPSNFLIDCSTGKIIAKNLRGEALGEKLEELLK